MKVGDLVRFVEHSATEYDNPHAGLVLEIDISMWGNEDLPSGVRVLWCRTGVDELVYEDEVQVISPASDMKN